MRAIFSFWTVLITPSQNFGVVTVSFSKCLPWQAIHLLQCSTHFSKTCYRLSITSKFLTSELPFRGCKSPDLDCMVDVLMGFHWSTFSKLNTEFNSDLTHVISGLFQPWKGSSEARNFEVINSLQHIFEKWVECCEKCIACQGRYFKKETVIAPAQSSDLD